MSRNHIDFISAYCDSWCERCAFTERCSHFAMTSALAMCDGDIDAAIELAIAPAAVPGGQRPPTIGEQIAETMGDYEPSEKEMEAIQRQDEERRARANRQPLAAETMDYAVASRRWLQAHGERAAAVSPACAEAIEVLRRDALFIHVKAMRALRGRDDPDQNRIWGSAVQNDWNGSAKVCLLSMERSEAAWRTIAAALGDEPATVLGGMVRRLIQLLEEAFPKARQFRRPGFDERR
jgi:hypothetical protein